MAVWLRRDVVIDGRRIAARERDPAARETVVFLHGLGTHQRSWDRVADGLVGLRLITFDLAGHGRSDPSKEYSVKAFLEDLRAVIAQVGIADRYILVGHSIGADLALLHAAGSDGCGGIILVDGAFDIAPPETDWERISIMQDRRLFKLLMFVGRRIGVAPSLSVDEIRSLTEDVDRRRPRFGELLAALHVPALYVVGDQADKVPDGQVIQERKMRAISQLTSRYDVSAEYLPCGHLVPLRQPKPLAHLIRGFSTAAHA